LLATEPEADLFDALRSAESIGRPLGDNRFLARIERQTGRVLKPAKRGPKPSDEEGVFSAVQQCHRNSRRAWRLPPREMVVPHNDALQARPSAEI
jgi:hypothetical protein